MITRAKKSCSFNIYSFKVLNHQFVEELFKKSH